MVRPGHRGTPVAERGLAALAGAGVALGQARSLNEALSAIASALLTASDARLVVIRALDERTRALRTAAIATESPAVAAELEGARLPLEDVPALEEADLERLPQSIRNAAERIQAVAGLMIPVRVDGRLEGSLELLRDGRDFDDDELRLARLAAGQLALTYRAFRNGVDSERADADTMLALTGEALAAAADESHSADQVVRVAARAAGAVASLLWAGGSGQRLHLEAAAGAPTDGSLESAEAAAKRTLAGRQAVAIEALGDLPAGAAWAVSLQLGQPPIGALQLLYDSQAQPTEVEVTTLATFGVRAAQALRSSMHTRTVELELERSRALLAVVGQAISQLSLAHTLETAVARVGELLDADRVAVYLREHGRLLPAAGLELAGPHELLAERLLELTLGPFRSRGMLVVEDVSTDSRLAEVAAAAAEAGIEAVVAVPLLAQDDVIGLLGVFPRKGRIITANESSLLSALAAQLAVAVQNAQLHERAKLLGTERERALQAERAASKQVRALYEISRSFAQSLSLDATLDALASTIVEVLDLDIAVIGLPDERRDWLVPRALEIAEPRLEASVRTILERPLPFGAHALQRLFRLGEPFVFTPAGLKDGGPASALVPFLEHGWTGAAVPIATTAEVLASLTIISMRANRPVTGETVEQAKAIAGQAALAIDNARLYQQQKQFADTMQRSLLPDSVPKLEGLELGDAYESSARVEVGGDVYDFMVLPDGRLAVALGDVTGHGVDATADMAMAKFVFRSLAREHPEPADFLQSANEVIVGEIAPGKFITLAYLVIDPRRGEVSAAGAGHPPPRLVKTDGSISTIDVHGLVLGIEPGQGYDEARADLAVGDAVVLYTDGVIEARRDNELYGVERLDRVLSEHRALQPGDLARAVLDDCRSFARGELADDCAVVVVRRTG
jgi:serine phosphatase RsbU (regulator of sigma subunit)